jgi:hypothetical protein
MTRDKKALSRRELLKALTALGGAAAASSLLPENWTQPQVGAGALPAHAQSTADPVIDTLSLYQTDAPTAPQTSLWFAGFNYTDPLGQVGSNSQLHVSIDSECNDVVYDWKTLSEIGAVISGDGFSGQIGFNFSSVCGYYPWTLHVTLRVGGRTSNTLDQQFPD